ncbi:hypothetical protein HDA32_002408 [Spinactinospora alkalitolerans]|uniref:Iron-containing redox enzyme family protein n=1 Tax=Spinactinospora alkalitolerans TaxID=687207 RepID=A0A852TTN8_9ACTN|nr:iron-containing redox enzyme family protein [Spinactinospora alkalitolerans]NYE47288.1 hypothetical protein [Spinactinospora alkalitolerans]
MRLPRPRGALTEALFAELLQPPHELPAALTRGDAAAPERFGGALHHEDLQLALYACYELHYSGFDGVRAAWEWEPSLLALRRRLETALDAALREAVHPMPEAAAAQVPRTLADMAGGTGDGPSLPAFLQRRATMGQFREFVAHRSVYHLKEADPHTWAIPRTRGRVKAALVEIQADEYGGGRAECMHAELFRVTMRGLGLDDSYGAHVERAPAITLAVNNAMSLFGLHRARLGALLGHLAAFEMTSSLPNRAYSMGLRRLGAGSAARRFYDEHVQADAVHEQIAAHDMCGGFAAQHPEQAGEVLFGAAVCLALDRLFADHVLAHWERGETSLRAGAAAVPA